jgi:hypothetical protein
MTSSTRFLRLAAALPIALLGLPQVSSTVSPVRNLVSSGSSATPAALFESESIQLTDASLAAAGEAWGNLADFDFADGQLAKRAVRQRRRDSTCKTFPGDAEWPSEAQWELFDLLIDGALHKPAPLASVCYQSSQWGAYDVGRCADISGNWSISNLQ